MGKFVLLFVLLTAVAQVFPSCENQQSNEPVVIGWVEEKHIDAFTRGYVIVINRAEYAVPVPFWSQVKVGDLVKWDGTIWTIVKRAETHSSHHA